jgi:multidrug efflux pump subunit AcrA (membrane-fusion protein)
MRGIQDKTWLTIRSVLVAVVWVVLVAGCGGVSEPAQEEPPTPTPLPPAPALERPTYTVERGTIERAIEPNGRVTPVDMVQLAFHRSGRVESVTVSRNDSVQEGDVLAQLIQDEEMEELRDAEDALVQAQRDLESAISQKEKDIQRALNSLEDAQRALEDAKEEKQEAIREAEDELEEAHRDLGKLLPGGVDDVYREQQEALEDARREAKVQKDSLSEEKTNAQRAVLDAAEAVRDAQDAYSDAYWDKKWVDEHGTHPDEEEVVGVDEETGEQITEHRKLDEEEKRDFERAFEKAVKDLQDAQHDLEMKQRAAELAQEKETYEGQEVDEDVRDAQRELDEVLKGNNDDIQAQQRAVEEQQAALEEAKDTDFESEESAVEDAQLELEEARDTTFNSEIKDVETAERRLEKARKDVQDGQIIAPQDGEVLAIEISEGEQVEEFDPVIEIADPSNLEISAELSGEHMRELAEGHPVEISLLSRPDVIMPGVIRRMPSPYGSGGTGIVQEQDKSTRFEILDTKGQDLEAGSVAQVRIVLEQKEDVLLLPPEAIRSFEGRTFVVVREGDREQRVSVEIGIETPDEVEIVEGLEEGDIVVGQ